MFVVVPRVSQEHLDARRQQILAAARRCFVHNGFHATSMQDILREAELSAGALYRYFASKDEIVVAIAAEALTDIRAAFQPLVEADPPPPIDEAFVVMCTAIQERDRADGLARMAIQIWGEAVRSPELAERLRDLVRTMRELATQLVRNYQRRGEISPRVPAERVAPILLGVLPGFMLQQALFGDVDPAMAGEAIRALVAGHTPDDTAG